ncbi:class I SAM-dependent methyltransferase [Oceanobacillus piezotolerans]|uniref:Class I SAM-dependent methyltransferase n=1 Tax=Oceanobacillus piezotolerans TaxID=2448030 RepID=A0A498D4U0_9BACI|nr:class I SAM-dependent methyltransferase [Oceanobacillus piezotolerans]RLL40763.1 class I SAM-dependent methyltransferase [Oceanobacillus piezotolerans]
MTEHYFSQQPHSKSSPKTWSYTLRNKEYTFTSDLGVFSKNEVDYGSRILIKSFTEPDVEGDLLDLGCGYGPIGISLAGSYPDRNICMVDVNERAVALARKNAKENNLDMVEVIQSDGFSNIKDRSFAAVITNPPIRAGKRVVHGMFEGAKDALVPNGELWVVIQKKQGAPSAKEKLEDFFGEVDVVLRDKGYYVLKAKNV